MYVCICICIYIYNYIYPHIYTASVNTPIRRYTDRCVYADTPIAVPMPIRRSPCLRRYADRCVYSTFTVTYSQP